MISCATRSSADPKRLCRHHMHRVQYQVTDTGTSIKDEKTAAFLTVARTSFSASATMLKSVLNESQIRVEEHPTARNKAVITAPRAAGTVLLVVPALSTALLQTAKGRRCDHCHTFESETVRLRKCTGCASYWYCGRECTSHVASGVLHDPVSLLKPEQVSLRSG